MASRLIIAFITVACLLMVAVILFTFHWEHFASSPVFQSIQLNYNGDIDRIIYNTKLISRHFFRHQGIWNSSLRAPGLPLTDQPYNSSYKNPCYGYKQEFFCLPYFFLAGIPKCGTTELVAKLSWHPDIVRPRRKEPHWWTRQRYRQSDSSRYKYSVFAEASKVIKNNPQSITFDASGSTLWDNSKLFPKFGGNKFSDPSSLNVHYIYHELPRAKCEVIIRNPVDRLYSEYLYFNRDTEKSPQMFHVLSRSAINEYTECMQNQQVSAMHCLYAIKSPPHQDPRSKGFLYQLRIRTVFFPHKHLAFSIPQGSASCCTSRRLLTK